MINFKTRYFIHEYRNHVDHRLKRTNEEYSDLKDSHRISSKWTLDVTLMLQA